MSGFSLPIFKHEQKDMIKQRARVYSGYCDDLTHSISIIHCPDPCVINVYEMANFRAAVVAAAAAAAAATAAAAAI